MPPFKCDIKKTKSFYIKEMIVFSEDNRSMSYLRNTSIINIKSQVTVTGSSPVEVIYL